MTRYLSGLCVAGLGLCGGGWLVVAAVAFGGESAGRAGRVNLLTGAGLIAACCLSLVCWSVAWRRRMRADGVLADRSRLVSKRQARRNRRALSRDVRRAGKVAGRSARDARRAARRSARAASGGLLGGEVRSAAAGLGGGPAVDEPGSAVASHGTDTDNTDNTDNENKANGANGKTSVMRVGVNRSGGTEVNGKNGNGSTGVGPDGSEGNSIGLPGDSAIGDSAAGAAGDGAASDGAASDGAASDGAASDGAAALISQLREMLEPLLGATGSQPTLGEQPGTAGLPRRTPSASAFRPHAVPVPPQVPRAQSPGAWLPRQAMPPQAVQPPALPPRAVPRPAKPVDDDGLGIPLDSEESWW
jgi:hypothetical protein